MLTPNLLATEILVKFEPIGGRLIIPVGRAEPKAGWVACTYAGDDIPVITPAEYGKLWQKESEEK